MAPPADGKTPFKIDEGNRCVKCGKEIERSKRPYCPDCRRLRPPTGRRYRWALFPEKLEPGRAGVLKIRAYLFFVGVIFVAIGLICVVLVIDPEARREISGGLGFEVLRIIWAILGGACFTFAIVLLYAAVTGRVGKKWILRLIRLLGKDVPDWS